MSMSVEAFAEKRKEQLERFVDYMNDDETVPAMMDEEDWQDQLDSFSVIDEED